MLKRYSAPGLARLLLDRGPSPRRHADAFDAKRVAAGAAHAGGVPVVGDLDLVAPEEDDAHVGRVGARAGRLVVGREHGAADHPVRVVDAAAPTPGAGDADAAFDSHGAAGGSDRAHRDRVRIASVDLLRPARRQARGEDAGGGADHRAPGRRAVGGGERLDGLQQLGQRRLRSARLFGTPSRNTPASAMRLATSRGRRRALSASCARSRRSGSKRRTASAPLGVCNGGDHDVAADDSARPLDRDARWTV